MKQLTEKMDGIDEVSQRKREPEEAFFGEVAKRWIVSKKNDQRMSKRVAKENVWCVWQTNSKGECVVCVW